MARALSAGVLLSICISIVPAPLFAQGVNAQFQQELEPFIARWRGAACQTRPPGLSCRTNNPGAVTCASNGRGACTPVVRKYNGLPCRERNDTACFERVEFGIATMANLIFQKIQKGCTSIYAILENCEYSSRSAGNDSLAYAKRVSVMTGIGFNEKMDINNSIQMGKLITAMASVEAGKNGIGYNAEQLQKGLAYAYGTETLPAGTPGFVPGVGPFVYPGDISRISDVGPGMISPFSGQTIGASAVQGAYPSTGAPSNGGIASNGVSNENARLETNPDSSSDGPGVATIVAQWNTVRPSGLVLISWSTLNMRSNPVCTLSVKYADGNTEVVAEANAGSKAVRIAPDAAAGQAILTLRCTPSTGSVVEKTVSVTVE